MDLCVTDDPLTREQKRMAFARRLFSHGVRTQLITAFAGLTRNRQATLRRRLAIPEDTWRRGRSPRSLNMFLDDPLARTEAAAIAALCRTFGALPNHYHEELAKLLSPESRIRLCEAYEAYRACHPHTTMEFEDLLLLVKALAKGDEIQLGRCKTKGCRCAILVARCEISPRLCLHCEQDTSGW